MKNILITACNQEYFNACLTLIASVHRTSFNIIDEIYIYNLGLDEKSIQLLNKLKKVKVIFFEDLKEKYPRMDIKDYYSNPKQFAYRGILRHFSGKEGDLVFWLDCGALFLKSAKEVYDLIKNDDIFIVRDTNNKNFSWTHPKCVNIMNASKEELSDYQICSGIFGYKKGGKYQKLIDEALEFHYLKECVHGKHNYNYGPNLINGMPIMGHRHDQSIYSILVSRYGCPTQDLLKFGEWRTFNNCTQKTVIFVHRRRYNNNKGLLFLDN